MSDTATQGADAPVEVVQDARPITPTDNPQPVDTAGKPDATDDKGADDQKPDDQAQKPDEKKPDWQSKRIDQLYRQHQEQVRARELAERQRDEFRTQLEQLRTPQQQQGDAPTPQPGTPQFEALVKQEAARHLEQQRQQEAQHKAAARREAVVAHGDAEYGQQAFAQAADTLGRMGLLQNTDLMEGILESDKAHNIIAHLAANPEDAERIAGLSVRQQAKELARLEDRLSQKPQEKQVSKAPSPMKPVSGSGKREWSIYDPDIPQDVYEKIRGYRE